MPQVSKPALLPAPLRPNQNNLIGGEFEVHGQLGRGAEDRRAAFVAIGHRRLAAVESFPGITVAFSQESDLIVEFESSEWRQPFEDRFELFHPDVAWGKTLNLEPHVNSILAQ
jgi:hypothetical protein